jgi:hypothetical protein
MKKEIATEDKGRVSRREVLKAGSTAAVALASTGLLMATAACNSSVPVASSSPATTGLEETHVFKVLALWLAVTTKGLPSPIPPTYRQDLITAAGFNMSAVSDAAIFTQLYSWLTNSSNKPIIDAASSSYGQFLTGSSTVLYNPAQCPKSIQTLGKFGTLDPNGTCAPTSQPR